MLLGWALWTLANAVTQSTTVITKPWRQESMIPDCTRGTIGAFVAFVVLAIVPNLVLSRLALADSGRRAHGDRRSQPRCICATSLPRRQ